MERALLYTTVGKSKEYLKCLEWFCKSLMYTSRTTINLLVICDESFHTAVVNILIQFAFLNYYVMNVPNSTTSEEASKHKTKIFEFPQVFHFSRILFVDLDCLFLGDISTILNTPMNDNKLYVWPERLNVGKNNIIWYCLSREDNKNVCYYNQEHWKFLNKHNKLPFNAGLFMFRSSKLMEQHFNKLNHFMDNFKGNGFYEQSFMNTYFHLNNLSDYSIFNYDNVIMGLNDMGQDEVTVGSKRFALHKTFHSEFEKINTTIAHFSGSPGNGKSKADMMVDYYNKYKQLNPKIYNEYETRNEMIKRLVPEGATIVEIGVFQGEFAEVLADTNPKHLYLVDCWEPQGTSSGDVDGNNMKHFTSGIELWNSVKERYTFYPNISIHRQYSSEFLKSIEDLSVDVIYIDGDHSYEGVKADLVNAFSKIKKGGWIMGHDYEMNMKKAKHIYNFGVKRAVDEFCLEKGLKVVAKGLDGCVSYAIYVDLDEILDKKSLIDKMLAKQFTMVSKERLLGIYDKCSKFKDTDYSFVECGVARGGCLAMIKYAAGPNNKVFGLDSFEGMPDITEKDISNYNKSDPLKGFGKVGDNLSGGIENVFKTFRELSIDMKNVKLLKGFFDATLNVDENVNDMGKIAILRLDGDWYESTKVCLDKLYSKVIVGGIIIIDDYGHWVGAKRATDEFRAKHNITSPLIQTDYTEHYWVKEETLCELAEKYGVDKCPAIRHTYTPRYHELLAPLRKTIKTVLEIGIGNVPLMKSIVGENYKPGASLRMWRDYFPNAQIIGCDILRSVLFNDEDRIKTFFVDQSNEISLVELANSINVKYLDLIIDDGSHIEEHMILSFKTLWKYVKPNGGIYIIEDIKQKSVARFTTVAKELGFTDAELIYTHNGSDYWDGFVAFRRQ